MSKFRGMTDAELEELRFRLDERLERPVLQRVEEAPPEVASSSLAAAIYWSIWTLRQDKPLVLFVGVLGLLLMPVWMFRWLYL